MISYKKLAENILYPLKERELIREIQKISRILTTNRFDIKNYSQDEKSITAYTLFYLPTNFPKLKFVFDQLDKSFLSLLKESRLIDIGSGPGTYSLAWIDYFKNKQGNIALVDSSQKMLVQAKKILTDFYPEQKIEYLNSINDVVFKEKTTLLFGHSANEMNIKDVLKCIERLSPDHIIFIEPGTKNSFSYLINLREHLSKNYEIHYPCLSNETCPLETQNDWCHQVLRQVHAQEVERLSQLVKLDRKVMPMISHVYSKLEKKNQGEVNQCFLVQFLRESKFSFDWKACLVNNCENKIITIEILKKHLSKDETKKMRKWSVGGTIQFEIVKKISEVHWRIKCT